MRPLPAGVPQEKSHVPIWRAKRYLERVMRPQKLPDIPVSLEGNTEVGPCTERGRRLISACRTPVCLPPCRGAWCWEASGTYHQTTNFHELNTHKGIYGFCNTTVNTRAASDAHGSRLQPVSLGKEFSPILWVCFPNLALFAGRLFAPSCQIVFSSYPDCSNQTEVTSSKV